MNHPTDEQWIAYLYNELPRTQNAELKSHAAACAECSAQLATWRAVDDKLDGWKTPTIPSRPVLLRQPVKWGIAAMLMISFGFALARWTTPQLDPAPAQNALHAEFQQQLTALRAEQKAQVTSIIAELEKQRAIDYTKLRSDLDTVAVTAEANMRFTQRQIGQLSFIARNENSPSLNTP